MKQRYDGDKLYTAWMELDTKTAVWPTALFLFIHVDTNVIYCGMEEFVCEITPSNNSNHIGFTSRSALLPRPKPSYQTKGAPCSPALYQLDCKLLHEPLTIRYDIDSDRSIPWQRLDFVPGISPIQSETMALPNTANNLCI